MRAGSVLPKERESILELASRSLLRLFSGVSEGMFLLDHTGRIVWIDEGYTRFLPALGFSSPAQFIGRMVEDVVPNTQMRQVLETGKPVLIDLLTNRAGTFVVSRIPLHSEEDDSLIGAIGIILYNNPEASLQPLIQKFGRLQKDLAEARRELARQRRTRFTLANFVGGTPQAVEVKRQARRASQSTSPVLLLGETGTGKELLAQGIHAASPRADGPMVSVNIAAVPDALLEAEFFGVTPGAYTGADRRAREGKFKLADGGTLFLDEIGDMPVALQPKLLRALEQGEIEPLGSNQLVPFDVRVIAATSRDLAALVREGKFREDLYYRLNVLTIRVPPLRERAGDIPLVVEALAEQLGQRAGTGPVDVDADAMALLAAQAWRGNIRELRNVLEQAVLRSDAGRVEAASLLEALREAGVDTLRPAPAAVPAAVPEDQPPGEFLPLAQQIRKVEHDAIREAMRRTRGNKLAAAQLLGVSRNTLYQRLAELGLS